MAIAIPAGNQSLINAEMSQALVAALQERSNSCSCRDTAAPLRIPVAASTAPAVVFVAPRVEISDSNVAIAELPLLPSERTSLKTLTKLSNGRCLLWKLF